jgi:MinD superfamily P-loop ATPase
MFVICNCDDQICCPTRVYNVTGISIYTGPYRAVQDDDRCLEREQGGACVTRRNFGANKTLDGNVLLEDGKCMGCGLCVTTCRGKARRLERRADYSGRLLPWDYDWQADVDGRQV